MSIQAESKSGVFNPKALAVIFLAHLTGDFFQGFFGPVLPLIKNSLGFSLTELGLLVSIVTLTSYLAQPVMGVLADRNNPRTFMIIGLMVGALFIPLMAITPWFIVLIPLAALGAVGSSMYHPTTAALVGQVAGDRVGFSMSIFGLGGTVGFALGPLAATVYIDYLGLHNLPYTTILGVVMVCAVALLVPKPALRAAAKGGFFNDLRHGLGPALKPIVLLWLISSMRALADVALRTFYPIMYLEKGESLVSMGLVLSLFVLGGSASALICGNLADRRGYKPIFYVSYALSTPFAVAFLYSSGWWVYPASFMSGFVLLATMFPTVALANQLAPHNRALASSLTLGFAVGTGGILSPVVGWMAEAMGIQNALLIVAFVPLLCLIFIPAIPGREQMRAAARAGQAA